MAAPLSASAILRIWEMGHGETEERQTMALLRGLYEDRTEAELAALPLGVRDRLLLESRQALFGSQMEGFSACPTCGERLTYTVDAGPLLALQPEEPAQPDYLLVDGPYSLRFRLPSTLDLASAASFEEPQAGRLALVERCLLAVTKDGDPVAPVALPDSVLAALGRRMAACDPLAELLFDLTCPACEQPWQTLLAISPFLWKELAVLAKRLMTEVHLLASTYGWSEAAILAMTAARRQFYLELV